VVLRVPQMETQALPHPMNGAMGHTGTGPLLFCSDITNGCPVVLQQMMKW